MTARASAGTNARSPNAASKGAGEYMGVFRTRRNKRASPETRLTPQQSDILDALRCLNPCPVPDIMEAARVASVGSLKAQITKMRNAGYHISPIYGLRGVRESAYQLVGEP